MIQRQTKAAPERPYQHLVDRHTRGRRDGVDDQRCDVFRVIGWAMGPSAELRLGRREGGRRLSGPQPHLRLAGAVGIERGDVVAQPQAAII